MLPRCDITRISIWHREQDLKTINGGRALLVHIPVDTSDDIGLIDGCGGSKRKFEDEDEESQEMEREASLGTPPSEICQHVTQDPNPRCIHSNHDVQKILYSFGDV